MKSFYVGVKAIIEHDDSILFLKRSSKEQQAAYYWDMPGGRVDGEENFEETLVRELSEEIRWNGAVHIEKQLYSQRLPISFENGHGLVLVYFKVSAPISNIILSQEHEEYRWIKKENLEAFLQSESEYIHQDGLKKALDLALQ